MSNIHKSARGEMVDFDLIRIKNQIAQSPKPPVVQSREDFIDQRFKRKLKKMSKVVSDQVEADVQDTDNLQE